MRLTFQHLHPTYDHREGCISPDTSGTTGRPKAAMHRHGAIPVVCETHGSQVLGIQPDDRCLSSAKAPS